MSMANVAFYERMRELAILYRHISDNCRKFNDGLLVVSKVADYQTVVSLCG
jgi:hypothetical protein